ncbi:hypothetical protein [Xanthomonas arboricola]|uniref:hypothetical protein n=1 Tax=Xanthomonas arboricola TaxID=56448 RepID=UPI0011B04C65|nr:hypothetical protein [Xanthomonas arboricola]
MNTTNRIGVLAFGSLIDDPGEELGPLIVDRIAGVMTPFAVEFARVSKTRGDSATLVPVDQGGSPVAAVILELAPSADSRLAMDMIWRRETRAADKSRRYSRPLAPGPNTVLVEELRNFAGFDAVYYTRIGATCESETPAQLAERAVKSVRMDRKAEDGITYLLNAKQFGIRTPKMAAYEAEILSSTNTASLADAVVSAARLGQCSDE